MPRLSTTTVTARIGAWLERWGPILPLLLAEFVLWLGFGAMLPILPLYFLAHGIDLAMLGLVVAAWPAARLVAEPIFGWVADRTARKPIMVGALLASAVVVPLPLVFTTPAAFILLRAAAGLATAAYDPAARGYLVDATPAERRGEAFGLYGASQMAGLLIGPALGGLGTAFAGSDTFVFVLGGVASLAAGLVVATVVRERPLLRAGTRVPPEGVAEMSSPVPSFRRTAATDSEVSTSAGSEAGTDARAEAGNDAGRDEGLPTPAVPRSLANRLIVAAVVINAGSFFASGTYEVVWSLYLRSLGAGLDLIGATFAVFGIPILVLSPFAGRFVDRRGGLVFIVLGSLMPIVAGILYTLIRDPALAIPIILLESTGVAIASPALYAVVAAGSPPDRSATAQGVFGAAGTVGFIASSLVAGQLASVDLRYPFWMFSAVMSLTLAIGLVIGWRPIRSIRPARGGGARDGAAPDSPHPTG